MEAIQPSSTEIEALAEYRYEPVRYIEEKLGWTPWRGSDEHPGQGEVLDAYALALRQQHERLAWQNGEIEEEALEFWTPGDAIKSRLRIEAGHTVGKTKLSSGLVNHFFDCFAPSIIYTFAPTAKQIHDLLWKEIKTDRRGKGLPGRILDLELKVSDNHFANGTATNDSGGKGTERIQGQHGRYLMFVLDEAEGIPDFVYNAVDSMASGGICMVLMLANPRTRSSRFHKSKALSTVKSFRISCIHHPNVIQGKEIVPGAVRREYVEEMIEKHCEEASAPDDDNHTFSLPFTVQVGEEMKSAGTLFLPNAEFLFRVLGIAPANMSDNTLITVGRYEAACKRQISEADPGDLTKIRMGADVARFGKDFGTLYIRHGFRAWRARQFWKQDTNEYYHRIKEEALALKAAHPEAVSLRIRIDAGGGFGGGVIDKLKIDGELQEAFPDFRVVEVDFGGSPRDEKAYADRVTEMYGEAAETLKGIRILRPPETLEADLCERIYGWVNKQGIDLKKLEKKDEFRKPTRVGRSPDDGDGFVMAVAPDTLFPDRRIRAASI